MSSTENQHNNSKQQIPSADYNESTTAQHTTHNTQ